jgi:hypothetical protein
LSFFSVSYKYQPYFSPFFFSLPDILPTIATIAPEIAAATPPLISKKNRLMTPITTPTIMATMIQMIKLFVFIRPPPFQYICFFMASAGRYIRLFHGAPEPSRLLIQLLYRILELTPAGDRERIFVRFYIPQQGDTP